MSIERKQSPDYREMRSDEPRVYVGAHVARQVGWPAAYVMPASMMQIGKTRLGETWHPTVTLFSLQSAAALCFLPNAEELEVFGEAMIKAAKDMREAADAQLAAALKRGKPE